MRQILENKKWNENHMHEQNVIGNWNTYFLSICIEFRNVIFQKKIHHHFSLLLFLTGFQMTEGMCVCVCRWEAGLIYDNCTQLDMNIIIIISIAHELQQQQQRNEEKNVWKRSTISLANNLVFGDVTIQKKK